MKTNINTSINFNGKEYINDNLSHFTTDVLLFLKDIKEYNYISYNSKNYVTNDGKKRKLDNINEINEKIDEKCNVYFLLDSNNDLLYVGKSLNIKKRLKEHLIECNQSTSSKIVNVHNHLDECKKTNKDLVIRYMTMEVEPASLYGTIEGIIISECNQSGKKIWNIRKS